MNGYATVSALPSTGAGTAAAGTAGVIGTTQGFTALAVFGGLLMALTMFNMVRLRFNEFRLRRQGRLDE